MEIRRNQIRQIIFQITLFPWSCLVRPTKQINLTYAKTLKRQEPADPTQRLGRKTVSTRKTRTNRNAPVQEAGGQNLTLHQISTINTTTRVELELAGNASPLKTEDTIRSLSSEKPKDGREFKITNCHFVLPQMQIVRNAQPIQHACNSTIANCVRHEYEKFGKCKQRLKR